MGKVTEKWPGMVIVFFVVEKRLRWVLKAPFGLWLDMSNELCKLSALHGICFILHYIAGLLDISTHVSKAAHTDQRFFL